MLDRKIELPIMKGLPHHLIVGIANNLRKPEEGIHAQANRGQPSIRVMTRTPEQYEDIREKALFQSEQFEYLHIENAITHLE